jgi:hypothetical protein
LPGIWLHRSSNEIDLLRSNASSKFLSNCLHEREFVGGFGFDNLLKLSAAARTWHRAELNLPARDFGHEQQ